MSRDVVFQETSFPSLKHTSSFLPFSTQTPFDFSYISPPSNQSIPLISPTSHSSSSSTPYSAPHTHSSPPHVLTPAPLIRRSVRPTHQPAYLDDYVCNHAVLNSSPFDIACIHDCPHTLTSLFSIPNHICCFTISSPNQQLLNSTNDIQGLILFMQYNS